MGDYNSFFFFDEGDYNSLMWGFEKKNQLTNYNIGHVPFFIFSAYKKNNIV